MQEHLQLQGLYLTQGIYQKVSIKDQFTCFSINMQLKCIILNWIKG